MPQQVIIGNAATANASRTKGWVIGHFISEGLCQTGGFEIKIWHYDSSPDYGIKIFGGTEFFIVEKGTLQVELEIPDGNDAFAFQRVKLYGSNRDYIVIPPNCKKQVIVLEAPAFGVTVRWPSAPGTNVVLKEKGES